MDTDPKKQSLNAAAVQPKSVAEKELLFVLYCLVSSTNNGGRVDWQKVAHHFGIARKGASDKLWRIKQRYGLNKNQMAGNETATKAQKHDDHEKVKASKGGKQKQETPEKEDEEQECDGEDPNLEDLDLEEVDSRSDDCS